MTDIWVVEYRSNPNDVTVAFLGSTDEKAIGFIQKQKPEDWDNGGYFAVYSQRLDDEDIINMDMETLSFYSLNGLKLDEQPVKG